MTPRQVRDEPRVDSLTALDLAFARRLADAPSTEDSMTTAAARKPNLASVERTAEPLHLGLQDLADIAGRDQSTRYRWRCGLSHRTRW